LSQQRQDARFFYQTLLLANQCARPAALINTGSAEGIQGYITTLGHEPHNYVTFYVQVDDLQAYLNKANQLGGKTLVPPVEIPGQGSFAWLADLDGNIIGLWKPMSK
jgi:uncharacterized protein